MSLLRLDNLSVSFGGIRALSNVSIEIPEGQIHGLIGPNGAGKTTLINSVSGLVALSSGRVVLDGKELQALPANQISEFGIGRTFQHAEIFLDQTVLENVMCGSYKHRASNLLQDIFGVGGKIGAEREVAQEAEATLADFGLLHLKDVEAADLPFGIVKKIDLARALMARPRILMLDEPTSGMNEEESQDIVRICRHIANSRGVTLLLIEHNMRVVMGLAQTIHVLNFGQKISEGSPVEIQRDAKVIEAYLGSAADA